MAGTPYDGGGIGVSVAATRAASDDELRALLAVRVAEARALGTTTLEVKSGYGLTVEDEARALRLAPRGHVRDDVPRRPRRAARGAGGPGGLRRPRHRPDARRPARRTPAGSTSSASRTARTPSPRTRRAGSSSPGRDAGLGLRVHGNQLGPGPGRAARRRARGGERRPLHLPRRRRRRRPRRGGRHDGRDPAARRRVLDPVARTPTRRGPARRRRLRGARLGLQPRHLQHRVDAVRRRPRGARDADDGRRGARRRDRRRGPGAAPGRRRAGRRGLRGPTWPCSRPRATSTWPTGRGCRSPGPSTSAGRRRAGAVRRSARSVISLGRWPDELR